MSVVLQMEFENFSVNVITHNWEACIVTGIFKEKVVVLWSPPIKFNVNGTVTGKQGLASIGNVLHNFFFLWGCVFGGGLLWGGGSMVLYICESQEFE